MDQWAYKCFFANYGELGRHTEEGPPKELDYYLIYLGHDGWELVNVVPIDYAGMGTSTLLWVFKKRVSKSS